MSGIEILGVVRALVKDSMMTSKQLREIEDLDRTVLELVNEVSSLDLTIKALQDVAPQNLAVREQLKTLIPAMEDIEKMLKRPLGQL